ncbi:Transposon TX1 uncharacterized 149 kDa protein [Vitis vinifera]|uniref:Transposon TX1 uncharacterized 149 kDa protein n=1 Tax=Vitis vinifera TaxID=29760 RepID=A0A438JLF3_VITVI|nr:Transposon TX1 uncharacterized 149 kDa protein [Vitis vinifera]
MEEEINSTLMDMRGDKALGLDGFMVAFWQFYWEFVKEEVLQMFKEFHEQNAFLKSLNNTFFGSYSKKGGAEELGDFRPISLLGGLYKLLAKVLANRIKNVIGRVVSSDQNAFVMGRQILDASLIANEVIDSWQKRGKKGLICKLDIEKAYDSVNWQFLMRVMQKMGFGAKWRDWIWSCISTAKFLVLVNGKPAGAVEGGCIFGCKIWRGRGQAVNISHLLFADDAIVFCEVRKDNMTYLSWILCWFEVVSGLRINLAKSEIILVREVEGILEMAVELGCKVGQLPSTYLGLPLGVPNKASCVWDGVEERMRWKLALWKRQYISKGDRITLIKSTLASMPLYQLSLFHMPRTVEFGWRTKKANGAFGVGVWKEILKEADWCWDNMTFKVGKGTRIRCWDEPWCGDVELSRRFPQLFTAAAQRNATVGDMWDQNSGQGGWNLRFIRGFNDWELNMVGELLQILRSQRITLKEDSTLWKGGKKGKFGVKEAYGLLISPSVSTFPKKGIWVENVPSKLAFFAWEATWGRVLTFDRLQKRG